MERGLENASEFCLSSQPGPRVVGGGQVEVESLPCLEDSGGPQSPLVRHGPSVITSASSALLRPDNWIKGKIWGN